MTKGAGVRKRRMRGLSIITGRVFVGYLGSSKGMSIVISRRGGSTVFIDGSRRGGRNGCYIIFSPLSNSSGVSTNITVKAVFKVFRIRSKSRNDVSSTLQPNQRVVTTNCTVCNDFAVLILTARSKIGNCALSPMHTLA